jgi:hypothetical protein
MARQVLGSTRPFYVGCRGGHVFLLICVRKHCCVRSGLKFLRKSYREGEREQGKGMFEGRGTAGEGGGEGERERRERGHPFQSLRLMPRL